jgi:putative ABC transport system permease protein
MISVALRGLLGRKLRAALTAIAIVLGVAMVSGTYVLTDTIKAAFGTVFTTVYKNTDAIVTGKSAIGGNANKGDEVPALPDSLLTKIRGLPQVADAEGGIADQAKLVGRGGKVINTHGAPNLAFSIHPKGDQRFNPLTLVSGSWPVGAHEVGIDANTADKKQYVVGQSIGVIARGPVQQYKISAIVKIGGVSSLGSATIAVFDFPTAQRIFHKQGELDTVSIAGRPNVTPADLVRAVQPVLPPTAQVRTGQAEAKQATKDTSGALDIFNYFLLAFGGVALFVGTFVIANTLSITIAQRTRELATLRSLGATRRQVRRSVLLEGFVIGTLASLVGLFAGLGLAKGLNALFVKFGIDLPQAGTVFATRTIVVALVVGIVVTLIASLLPAIRATRVPPIAAVREGALLPPSRLARFGIPGGLTVVALSVALMLVGLFAGGIATKWRLISLGVGAALLFVGVAILAPTLVPPLGRVLGWPAARFGGAAGGLARGNVVRNPARTATTAAALMIGLALVTLVGVLAAGLKTRFEGGVNETFISNYALTAQDNFTPLGVAAGDALAKVPGVTDISSVRAGQARVFGSRIGLTAVQPNLPTVMHNKWAAGGTSTPAHLGANGAFVSKSFAKKHHLSLGSTLTAETPDGPVLRLAIRGIYDPPKGAPYLGDLAVSTQTFDRAFPTQSNLFTLVNMRGGDTAANSARLERALQPFPDAKIQTISQFKKNQLQGLTLLLNLLYVLLSLSIIVSLFGIVNTLVLTVFERTRELGMLRAVGMTRRQVRRMIRQESVVTALLGATLGIPLGVVLAWMVGEAINYPAFTIPWGTLISFVVAAIIVGLLAAVFPARRAGRLNVLEALQYE